MQNHNSERGDGHLFVTALSWQFKARFNNNTVKMDNAGLMGLCSKILCRHKVLLSGVNNEFVNIAAME